jgi:hypothetical protein
MNGLTLLIAVAFVLWLTLTLTLPEDPPARPYRIEVRELGEAAPSGLLWAGIFAGAVIVLGLFG